MPIGTVWGLLTWADDAWGENTWAAASEGTILEPDMHWICLVPVDDWICAVPVDDWTVTV